MELLKIIILIFIFGISSYIGILISQKYINRVYELKEFKSSLNILKTKVELTHEPLRSIFDELSNTNNKNLSNFFKIVSKNMENTNASVSWIEALESFKTNLNKEDIEVLKGLGSLLRKS